MWWLLACTSTTPPAVPPDPPVVAAEVPAAPPPAPAPPPVDALPSGPFQRVLRPGLVLAAHLPPDIPDDHYSRPAPSDVANIDPRIFVLTADPASFELVYHSSIDPDATVGRRPADEWAAQLDLLAAWNPGMFEPDEKATGYTRGGGFESQPGVRRQSMYTGFFVASDGKADVLHIKPPKGAGRYASRAQMPAEAMARLDTYTVVSQSLGILEDGKPVYPPRTSQWSELAYGVNDQGHIAVVFTRYPYEMKEFGARVAALGIGLKHLIHGEGGPEASFVVHDGPVQLALCGSYETGFYDDRNDHLWTVPAVMGIRAK